MQTTMHAVDLRYTHTELLALFAAAERLDVEKGGRYDRRAAAINVWSHAWTTDATRHDSDTIGTFYARWGDDNCLYRIECEAGFDLAACSTSSRPWRPMPWGIASMACNGSKVPSRTSK
jgi:hypothetical protein